MGGRTKIRNGPGRQSVGTPLGGEKLRGPASRKRAKKLRYKRGRGGQRQEIKKKKVSEPGRKIGTIIEGRKLHEVVRGEGPSSMAGRRRQGKNAGYREKGATS